MSREVLVAIGTGGMGRARRSASGRKVLLAYFDEPALAAVADELRGDGCDLTSQAVGDGGVVAAVRDMNRSQ